MVKMQLPGCDGWSDAADALAIADLPFRFHVKRYIGQSATKEGEHMIGKIAGRLSRR
jgi:hypothetical protein